MIKASLAKKAQCARLLNALREHGEVATSDAREILAIMSPAVRVHELRKQGHAIETRFRYITDAAGVEHRQGVYLMGACDHG
jgi:hypothetical protein